MTIESVTVRMYRRLLGDCFLIRIAETGGETRHILIDCGLLQGLDAASERMKAVAANIVETCGGKLDLVVVTHEHYDHISGFAQAKDFLLDPDKIRIDKLWMAWTEKPGDTQADALRGRFERRNLALAAFASAFATDGDTSALLDGLDRFIGPLDDANNAFGAAPTGRLTGRRIMEELKSLVGKDNVDYLEPGAIIATPGDAPLTVAVLAPPRDEKRLFKDLPSKGENKETYLDEEFLAQSFGADASETGSEPGKLASPFAPKFWHGLEFDSVQAKGAKAASDTLLRGLYDRYFADTDPEEARAQDYRRIDGVWTQAASALALKLDSDTNNTSLVLAFRLPDESFMLFAADAQVGNWLSWHDQSYAFSEGSMSAEDILNRTRLYKVGHHGSHNATLRAKGVEMMTRDDLVAMISTVEKEAASQGKKKSNPDAPGWRMPDEDVKEALLDRCRGRVVIGDRRWRDHHDKVSFGEHSDFAAALDEKADLYVDYKIFERAAA